MKKNILHKATDLFIAYGFKSVTMDDLANEMGISKKTIYKHYNNKTELVEAAAINLFEVIATGINLIRAEKNNPIEEIFAIKKFVLQHLKDEKSSPQYQLQKYYPKIYNTLQKEKFNLMQACVTENLTFGIEQGLYRNSIDIQFISRIYFSGINSIKDIDLFPQELFPAHIAMENYLEYHLRGICTEKGLNLLTKLITKK